MKELFRNIYLLEAGDFKFPHCNCLFLEGEGKTCLIDSSPPDALYEHIKDRKINMVVNSHGHFDHVSRSPDFKDSQIYLHKADWPLVESPDGYLELFGFKAFPHPYVPYLLPGIGYRTFNPSGTIEEGQRFDMGTILFEVIELPGHTWGHCGFIFPKEGILFTSDIALDRFGPWYGTLNADLDQFIQSIERVMNMYPDFIVTSHGQAPITARIRERLASYRDIIYKREERIIAILHGLPGLTLDEIAGRCPIYRKLPKPQWLFFHYERIMVLHHLIRLKKLDRIEENNGRYYLKPGVHPGNVHLG